MGPERFESFRKAAQARWDAYIRSLPPGPQLIDGYWRAEALGLTMPKVN